MLRPCHWPVQQRRGYTVANADRRLSIIFYAERQIAPSRGNLGNFTLNGKNYLNSLAYTTRMIVRFTP